MSRNGTGILCPLCGCNTEVIETRRNLKSLRRRRHCLNVACTGRVTTVELVVSHRHKFTTDMVLISRSEIGKLVDVVRALDLLEDA